jgi:hypothetical protein
LPHAKDPFADTPRHVAKVEGTLVGKSGSAVEKVTEQEALIKSKNTPVAIGSKLRMTPEGAALAVQRRWHGHLVRKNELDLSRTLNLEYEQRIVKLKGHRTRLVCGFGYHILFMALTIIAYMMQHGTSVNTRYSVVETLKNQIGEIYTPSGITFDSVTTTDDIWDWLDALLAETGGRKRVFVRTYNQIVGSVSLETTRVSNASCAYKGSEWSMSLLETRRPKLFASEALVPRCFGPSEGGLDTTAYGPFHDPTRWESSYSLAVAGPSFKMDLGKDPEFAEKKITEMRTEGFLSKHTRRVLIKMTVYNNALPMLCFVKLVFEVKPTGVLQSFYKIEAMNVVPYLNDDYILELIIEVIVLILAVIHVALELGTIKDVVFVKGQFSSKRLVTYISNGWHILSWAQDFLFIAFVAHWIWLIFDSSRDVDLDTEEFVDLEDVGRMTQQYNLIFNIMMIVMLFNLLKFTDLDNRMSLLTKSVFESASDLLPFLFLFLIFILVFGCVGYLLYGPLLYEWSTIGNSVVTAIDLFNGNYGFQGLEAAVDRDAVIDYAVAAVYFYVYFFLMMLISLNIIIAILMDGYASVKVREQPTLPLPAYPCRLCHSPPSALSRRRRTPGRRWRHTSRATWARSPASSPARSACSGASCTRERTCPGRTSAGTG